MCTSNIIYKKICFIIFIFNGLCRVIQFINESDLNMIFFYPIKKHSFKSKLKISKIR